MPPLVGLFVGLVMSTGFSQNESDLQTVLQYLQVKPGDVWLLKATHQGTDYSFQLQMLGMPVNTRPRRPIEFDFWNAEIRAVNRSQEHFGGISQIWDSAINIIIPLTPNLNLNWSNLDQAAGVKVLSCRWMIEPSFPIGTESPPRNLSRIVGDVTVETYQLGQQLTWTTGGCVLTKL